MAAAQRGGGAYHNRQRQSSLANQNSPQTTVIDHLETNPQSDYNQPSAGNPSLSPLIFQEGDGDDPDRDRSRSSALSRWQLPLLYLFIFMVFLALLTSFDNIWAGYRRPTTFRTPTPAKPQPPPAPLSVNQEEQWTARRNQVVDAFRHAWKGYRQDAFGSDEYAPMAHRGFNLSSRGLGYTIVDSLDTMLIMNLDAEYKEARDWVAHSLDFNIEGDAVSVFETNIRTLGGLLSAHHLSKQDPIYLTLAVDLADRLMKAWTLNNDYPSKFVYLALSPEGSPERIAENQNMESWKTSLISLAEVGTLQLEFAYLSHLTKDPKYHRKAQAVMRSIQQITPLDGLWPVFMDPFNNSPYSGDITMGAHGDSYYEYLLKQWIQTRGHADQKVYRDMYDASVEGVKRHLVRQTVSTNIALVGDLWLPYLGRSTWDQYVKVHHLKSPYKPQFFPKAEHLSCFLPGLLALGATRGYSLAEIQAGRTAQGTPITHTMQVRDQEDLDLAEKLAYGCWQLYDFTATGLAPEMVRFRGYQREGSPYLTRTSAAQKYIGLPRTQWSAPMAGDGSHSPPRSEALHSDFDIPPDRGFNLLRPETIESLFILWRITKKVEYREMGWKIFMAFEKFARLESGGYTSLHDVTVVPPPREDKMETFFLAETLKYLYLLFSPDSVVPLTEYVFNTEAHPFPILDKLPT